MMFLNALEIGIGTIVSIIAIVLAIKLFKKLLKFAFILVALAALVYVLINVIQGI